jgi:hypothetical protein
VGYCCAKASDRARGGVRALSLGNQDGRVGQRGPRSLDDAEVVDAAGEANDVNAEDGKDEEDDGEEDEDKGNLGDGGEDCLDEGLFRGLEGGGPVWGGEDVRGGI